MADTKFLTTEDVSERYRGEITVGTLRNWRAMRIGPPFVKICKPSCIQSPSLMRGTIYRSQPQAPQACRVQESSCVFNMISNRRMLVHKYPARHPRGRSIIMGLASRFKLLCFKSYASR